MTSLACAQCGSSSLFKNGKRKLRTGGKVQTYICRECAHRFTEPRPLQVSPERRILSPNCISTGNQICVQEAKNLEPQTEIKTVAGDISQQDIKGKILQYGWWLKKDGKSDSTIESRVKLLQVLAKRGANLYDPESIKETIVNQTWSNGRKNNAVDAYSSYLKMVGGTWKAPLYTTIRKLPFIPKESEIDILIAVCTKRMGTFLQMLKETGARCGEIWRLKWDDVDFESKIVNITAEKNSNPRVVHLSNKLLDMLQYLPKAYGDRIFSFPHMPVDHFSTLLIQQRKRAAHKIQNPRLLKIHFHTFRYWKGTMVYHETKDMYYVMQKLGHKQIKNTLLYVQLEEALFQGETNYISKVAKTEKDICSLVEAGFEYVTEFEGSKIFRKRKL
jgi:integrase